MWRVLTLGVALTFVPFGASAQQCTDARRVVDELYRHMLERSADAASAEHVRQLESGRTTVRDLVRSMAKSAEYNQRFIKQESGEERPFIRSVERLYRHVLGRAADADGARMWADRMAREGRDPVVDALVTSAEYNEKYGDWGVPGSGGLRYCPNNQTSNTNTNTNSNSNSNTNDGSRFGHMDRNGDGRITRDEWRGNNRSFQTNDWNGDGVLTGDEIRGNAGRPAPTSGDLIVVSGTQRWTDTGIDVRAGDRLTFDAEGSVRLSEGGNDTASPSGSQSGRRAQNAPVPSAPAGGLIARIGDTAPVYVGDRRAVRAPTGGRLFLGVNDDHLGDNGGDYRVTVNVGNGGNR